MKINIDLKDSLTPFTKKTTIVPKGSLVLSAGTAFDEVIFILRGKLRLYSDTPEGKELSLHYLENNDVCLISVSCAIKNYNFPVSVQAMEETEFVTLKKNDFYQLLSSSPPLMELILSSLSERISDLLESLRDYSFLSLRQRVAKFLLKNERDGVFSGSHDAIAKELGSSREVISRSIKSLSLSGLLSGERNKIHLKNRSQLRSLCDSSH